MIDVGTVVLIIMVMTWAGLFAGIVLGYELAMDTLRADKRGGT